MKENRAIPVALCLQEAVGENKRVQKRWELSSRSERRCRCQWNDVGLPRKRESRDAEPKVGWKRKSSEKKGRVRSKGTYR